MIPERLQPVLDDVRPLAERFVSAGHAVYLVGGIVRDLVLGRVRAGADLDLTTDARPEQTRAIVSGYLPGETPSAAGWERAERLELDGWAADLLVSR